MLSTTTSREAAMSHDIDFIHSEIMLTVGDVMRNARQSDSSTCIPMAAIFGLNGDR